jgi:hypothetical protein
VQAVKDKAEDDGVEFAAYIPTALDIAEERLFRELELPDLKQEATGTMTSSVATLTKPTGMKLAHSLLITRPISNERKLLKFRSHDYLLDYWPVSANVGEPKYYTTGKNTTQIVVAPTPNSNYSYTLTYTKQPTKLSLTNTTNYFTSDCQDILFDAVMIEMGSFMKAPSIVQQHEQSYAMKKAAWNGEDKRRSRDDLETPINPEGGGNSIRHTEKTYA